MDGLFEAIFRGFMEGVSRLITDRIAAVFGIEADTPAWRNLNLVVAVAVALIIGGGCFLILASLAAAS